MKMFSNANLKKLLCIALAATTILTFASCTPRGSESSSEEGTSSSELDNPLEEPSSSKVETKVEEPKKETVDKIKTAKQQNGDVKGWITIPNTAIDNEILQYTDNIYYERRDITKNYNWYGCYYADAGNVIKSRKELTPNTIIYGHNMEDKPDGKKFSQLMKYKDLTFAKNNPYIYITTEQDEMVFQVFSVMYTDTSFEYHLEKPDKKGLQYIIDESKRRSELIYEVDVNSDDKILTLSTCTYKYGGEANKEQRFVVQARLLRAGEAVKPTVDVIANPAPKAPTFSKKY